MDRLRICKIADLFVEIPMAGGMSSRCEGYFANTNEHPDIVIREERYDIKRWPGFDPVHLAYMDSGWQFYTKLIRLGGMMLHASAVELNGEAYLFSGPSGIGKSTHTRLWTSLFPEAKIFNDDKPALRKIDGVWYAYGTPWCGKDGINLNIKAPLKGICFLRHGDSNSMRRLSAIEALSAIFSQTQSRFSNGESLGKLTSIIEQLIRDIPIYELVNTAEEEAALLSHKIMSTEE